MHAGSPALSLTLKARARAACHPKGRSRQGAVTSRRCRDRRLCPPGLPRAVRDAGGRVSQAARAAPADEVIDALVQLGHEARERLARQVARLGLHVVPQLPVALAPPLERACRPAPRGGRGRQAGMDSACSPGLGAGCQARRSVLGEQRRGLRRFPERRRPAHAYTPCRRGACSAAGSCVNGCLLSASTT